MNNFIDVCKLLGNYNDKDVYLNMSSKYKSNSIFYHVNYFLLPKQADPQTLTFMPAVKVINFRMKHKNSDSINVKYLMEEYAYSGDKRNINNILQIWDTKENR